MKEKNKTEKIKYDTLKLPSIVTSEIDKLLDKYAGLFTSRTDVVKMAVRDLKRTMEDEHWNGTDNKFETNSRNNTESEVGGNGLAKDEAISKGQYERSNDISTSKSKHIDICRDKLEGIVETVTTGRTIKESQ